MFNNKTQHGTHKLGCFQVTYAKREGGVFLTECYTEYMYILDLYHTLRSEVYIVYGAGIS